MDTTKYVAEIKRQLSDTEVYKELPGDPKWDFERCIKLLVDKAVQDGIIDHSLGQFILVKHPKTPMLYILPKIHKTLIDPPGRPIWESLFSHVGMFLDRVLREFACGAKSYIRDTADFLQKIRGLTLPVNSVLGSFDIVSLYTSIDHGCGMEATRLYLDQTEYDNHTIHFIMTLLDTVLHCNYFLFNKSFFLQ